MSAAPASKVSILALRVAFSDRRVVLSLINCSHIALQRINSASATTARWTAIGSLTGLTTGCNCNCDSGSGEVVAGSGEVVVGSAAGDSAASGCEPAYINTSTTEFILAPTLQLLLLPPSLLSVEVPRQMPSLEGTALRVHISTNRCLAEGCISCQRRPNSLSSSISVIPDPPSSSSTDVRCSRTNASNGVGWAPIAIRAPSRASETALCRLAWRSHSLLKAQRAQRRTFPSSI